MSKRAHRIALLCFAGAVVAYLAGLVIPAIAISAVGFALEVTAWVVWLNSKSPASSEHEKQSEP